MKDHSPSPASKARRTHRLVHVLTVASSLDFLRGQAGYVAQHGFDVHAIAGPDGDRMSCFARAENIVGHELPMTRRIAPLQDLRSLLRLWLAIRRLSPDIVQAGTPKGGFPGIIAATLARVPVRIYHMHGIRGMTATGWRRSVLMTTEWLSCRLATRVLSVSASTRAAAIETGLCTPDKIIVLGPGSCNGVDAQGRFHPEAIDVARRQEARNQLALPADCSVLAFVGRVTRDKGIVELANAWARLASDFPKLYLIIVGPLEREDPIPEATLEALRSHPRVRFVDNVSDPAPLYAIIDIVALPTHREGLPTVLLEAAAMRLPVVATRVAGCVDAVIDGVTGTLVPARSAPALAAAVSNVSAARTARGAGGSVRARWADAQALLG